jgi:hypothetical protein
MPTQRRMRFSGRPRSARFSAEMDAWLDYHVDLESAHEGRKSWEWQYWELGEMRDWTHDITQGILIRLLTHPKLTLIPHNLVPPTILSLAPTSPVVKLSTAPAPSA